MVRILTVVPVRGGSKGVPGKNRRLLDGVPLVAHALRTVKASRFDQRLVLSTDCPQLAEIGRSEGAEVPFLRPAHLAGDEVPVTPVVTHVLDHLAAEGWEPDIVVSFQATNPLVRPETLDAAIQRMVDDSSLDSLVSVTLIRKGHPFRAYALGGDGVLAPLTEYTTERCVQKQERPPAYGWTGALFLRRPHLLRQWAGQGFAMGSRIGAVVVDEEEAVDIDSEVDFLLCQAILDHRRSKRTQP